MYEIWANQENPSMRLVKKQGTSFPAPRAMRDWSLLGLSRVADAIAETVEREGFDEIRSGAPFDPAAILDAKPGALPGAPDPL